MMREQGLRLRNWRGRTRCPCYTDPRPRDMRIVPPSHNPRGESACGTLPQKHLALCATGPYSFYRSVSIPDHDLCFGSWRATAASTAGVTVSFEFANCRRGNLLGAGPWDSEAAWPV